MPSLPLLVLAFAVAAGAKGCNDLSRPGPADPKPPKAVVTTVSTIAGPGALQAAAPRG